MLRRTNELLLHDRVPSIYLMGTNRTILPIDGIVQGPIAISKQTYCRHQYVSVETILHTCCGILLGA